VGTAAGASPHGAETIYRDSIVVAAPPERVWRVLTDYERLPEFIPGLERSRLLQDSLGARRVEQVGAAGWFFLKIRARVVLRVQECACSRIDFRAIDGDFDVFEGWWSLLPEDGGRATRLEYWADVQPSFRAPGFLTRFLVRRGLRERLVALQVRAAGGKARRRS
jgi:ribosome-associated toxin RatA of RatAB toxin-antitoxin module